MSTRPAEIPSIHPDEKENALVSFAARLDPGEVLTGTPSVEAEGLAITGVAVNSSSVALANGSTAGAGQAVQFHVEPGDSGTFSIEVSCGTTSNPPRTLVAICRLRVTDAQGR